MNNIHPLQDVDRASEIHLQMGENLNYSFQRFKGLNLSTCVLSGVLS